MQREQAGKLFFGWWMVLALFAIVMGVSSPVIGVLIGRFGLPKTMLATALLASICNLGYADMESLAGNIFDRTGSYEIVILFCIVGALLSSGLALLIRPDRYHGEFVTEGAGAGPTWATPLPDR